MRKIVLLTAAGLALALAPAALATAAAPGHDQATGTGALAQFGDPTAHVNAIQRDGRVSGSFTITYPDGTSVAGTVACAVATGTVAYATGQITESSGPRQATNNWLVGNYLVIGVQDNGEPGAGTDKLNFSPGFATHPGCGAHPDATPVFVIVDGNYRVVDGL